ncbi:MAG: apolipoprotein N-acyltransferase [Pseudomonadota bacterium]
MPAEFGWRRWPLLQSAAAGLTLPFAFSPFGLWWLAPIVVAWTTWLWAGMSSRAAFRAGYLFGFCAFVFGTYWIYISVAVFGQAPVWLAIVLMLGLVAIMATYYGLIALAAAFLIGPREWAPGYLAMPAIWAFAEWCRGWVLSGFPWLSLGYSQLDSPFAGYAPLAGVYGVSAMVVAFSVAGLVAVRSTQRPRWALLTLAATIIATGWLVRDVRWSEATNETVAVALVQGGITQDKKWLPESVEPTLALYRDLTLANADADVIVWPEVALPVRRQNLGRYMSDLDAVLRRRGAALAYGVIDVDFAAERYYNAVVAAGLGRGSYNKHHLVPFGEYFPVPAFIREWMKMNSLPYADMSSGAAGQPPVELAGRPVAVSICYEDAFATEQHHMFPAAEYLVNVTNDAWFGTSIAPYHHLDIARFRSLETGRSQLRVANTGITAIIGADGSVMAMLDLFEQGVLRGEIEPRRGVTPYVITGNWLPIGIAAVVIVTVVVRRRVVL